ncbi:hypothetical protein ACFORO_12410 [Amycolatopsis halotolerans]|uniref:Uncharacterized protein n=1 Tax=Amycolatopsis halotolerans TaxID=330083 RepID=A0ABV7QG24_9PSEU
MSPARWSDIVAKIEADGGPITPHPDAETARRLAENPPKHRSPVLAPKDTFHEAPLQVDEELPAPIAAQPYPAESTETRETVQTPAENESPREAAPGHRNGCQGCEHEEAAIPGCWSDEDCEAWYRFLAEPPLRTISADEARTALGLPPLSETKPVLLPNPPSRRGWFKIFRRMA